LVKKLDEAGSKEAETIVFSLSTLSGEGVDLALVEAMQSASNEIRVALISVLGERRSEIAVPALFEEAVSQDISTAEEAYRSLRDLVSPADLPKLLGLLDNLENDKLRSYAERAVTRAARRAKDPAESTTILLTKLKNVERLATRQSIIRVLGIVGGTDVFAALSDALKDDDASIRDTAIRSAVQAVTDWPPDEAERILLNIYTTTDVTAHRRLALQGYVRVMGQMDEEDAEAVIDKYVKVANHVEGPEEKKLLLSGVARVKHAEALTLTDDFFEDKDVHTEAAVAALTIARETNAMDNSWGVNIMEKLIEVSNDEQIRTQARKILQSASED
jgi:HEAT repeat protein